MKTIIAPVNFSTNSQNAVRYAADMAMFINADLQLIHILQIPLTNVDVPMTDYIIGQLQSIAENAMKDLQQELIERTKGKIQVYTTIEAGEVEYKIEEFCQQKKPFVVIMGVSGDFLEKVIVGSSRITTITHLHYPLIMVPVQVAFHSIKKIVLACDIQDIESGISISFLKELREIFNSGFEVINISTKKQEKPLHSVDNSGFYTWNEKLLGIRPQVSFIRINNVEDGINDYLINHRADLLLVFPKKHNYLEFHNSHAKRIAQHSPIPVMSIHP